MVIEPEIGQFTNVPSFGVRRMPFLFRVRLHREAASEVFTDLSIVCIFVAMRKTLVPSAFYQLLTGKFVVCFY